MRTIESIKFNGYLANEYYEKVVEIKSASREEANIKLDLAVQKFMEELEKILNRWLPWWAWWYWRDKR